jgi:hypothetical protein
MDCDIFSQYPEMEHLAAGDKESSSEFRAVKFPTSLHPSQILRPVEISRLREKLDTC